MHTSSPYIVCILLVLCGSPGESTRQSFPAINSAVRGKTIEETFQVTLAIFSGRRDPKWYIKPDNPYYQRVVQMFHAAEKNHLTQNVHQMPSRLGYKGFVIRKSNEKLGNLIFGEKTKNLQKVLLKTIPEGTISARLKNLIYETVEQTGSQTFHVTLAIFSGRPDPHWRIKPDNPHYQKVQKLFRDAVRHGSTYEPYEIPSRLGYKGFLLRDDHDGSIRLILGRKTKKLQKVLLQTMPKGIISKKFVDKLIGH